MSQSVISRSPANGRVRMRSYGAIGRSLAAGNWSSLASSILNGRWQSAGSILLAIRDDRPGIPLQAVVIQYTVACRRAVVAAHKISYKILILWTVPQPSSASDLVKIQRSVGHRYYAYRFFQAYHHTGTRVGLAPPSYVCDICPMQVKIYKRPPTFITKPAGHPSRELARRCSRHGEIFATGNAANIGRRGKRFTSERWYH